MRWLLALLVVLTGGWGLHAQGLPGISIVGPPVSIWGRSGYAVYPRHQHTRSITFISSSRLVGYVGTPLLYPTFPGLTGLGYPPPIIVLPAAGVWPAPVPRQVLLDDGDWQFDGRPIRPPRAEVLVPAQRPAPAAPAPALRPNRPDERREAVPPVVPPARPRPLVPKQAKQPEPARKMLPPEVPAPAVDRRQIDHAQQFELGKEALAIGEYGRAETRFQQAVATLPDDPLAYFLLAQAQSARGKYQEAVAAIETGLRLRPDWPTVVYRPRELYDNAADYAAHVKRLEAALARHPDDPVLVFLSAYQMWFDDRQYPAWVLFARSRKLAANPGPSDQFLKALPVGPLFLW